MMEKQHGNQSGIDWEVPSGELTFCHGKSQFFMGKSTISMAISNCFLLVHQRVTFSIRWEFAIVPYGEMG